MFAEYIYLWLDNINIVASSIGCSGKKNIPNLMGQCHSIEKESFTEHENQFIKQLAYRSLQGKENDIFRVKAEAKTGDGRGAVDNNIGSNSSTNAGVQQDAAKGEEFGYVGKARYIKLKMLTGLGPGAIQGEDDNG